MKLAIITLPLHANYGGVLQAYALQTILRRLGHQPVTIRWRSFRHSCLLMPLAWIKRAFGKYILKRSNILVFEEYYNRIIRRNITPFVGKYIKLGSVRSIKRGGGSFYDGYIVGSDQVWRPMYFPEKIEIAYLCFAQQADSIKRIAYAASFGTDEWEYTTEQTACCAKLLERFDGVSVREDVAVEMCRNNFGCEAVHVLDPTLLLTVADYQTLYLKQQLPSHIDGLLVYILDETDGKKDVIRKVSDTTGYKPFRVNAKQEDRTAPLKERIAPSVEKWLKGFDDAAFVVTDSFHACVFSILYHKPFIVYGNRSRGMSRFDSLLNLFGLEERFISSDEQLTEERVNKSIDWEKIDRILEEKRRFSLEYLTRNLNE